jgi:uncharacterized protein (TIGR02118 family)
MLVVTVMYPASDGATFDFDYYAGHHLPLVRRLWSGSGLEDVRALRGAPGPDGAGPTYVAIALLTFTSPEAFKASSRANGKEIFADIPKFTNISPVLQMNETLG